MKRRAYLKTIAVIGTAAASSSLSSCLRESPQLSEEGRAALLASLADTILPDTDDIPGALRADVPAFITMVLTLVFGSNERNSFHRGLQKIQDHAYHKYRVPFERCLQNDRLDMLHYFESRTSYPLGILNKIHRKLFGEPFIKQLKRLVIEGYCTSQLGATEGLAYDPIPIRYEACVPLSSQPRTWATE